MSLSSDEFKDMDNMDEGLDDFGDLNFDELDDLGGMDGSLEDFTLGDFDEQMNFELDDEMPSSPKTSARKKPKEPISPANSEKSTLSGIAFLAGVPREPSPPDDFASTLENNSILSESEWAVPVDEDSTQGSTETTQPFEDLSDETDEKSEDDDCYDVQESTSFANNKNLEERYEKVDVEVLPDDSWDIANHLVNIRSEPTAIPTAALPIASPKPSSSKGLKEMIPAITANNQMLDELNARTKEKLTEVSQNLQAFASVEDSTKELIASAKETAAITPCKLSDESIEELTKKATELGELYDSNDATIKQLRSEQDHARARFDDAVSSWQGFSVETREFFKMLMEEEKAANENPELIKRIEEFEAKYLML